MKTCLGSGGSVAIVTTAPATPALTADRLTAAPGSARGGAADTACSGAAFMPGEQVPLERSDGPRRPPAAASAAAAGA